MAKQEPIRTNADRAQLAALGEAIQAGTGSAKKRDQARRVGAFYKKMAEGPHTVERPDGERVAKITIRFGQDLNT